MAEAALTVLLYPTTFWLSVVRDVVVFVMPDPFDAPAVQRQINA